MIHSFASEKPRGLLQCHENICLIPLLVLCHFRQKPHWGSFHQRHRQTVRRTDRQTDGRTTYDSNAALALRASRGKNGSQKQIAPKRLKIRTSNLACMFPGAVRTWPLIFGKGGVCKNSLGGDRPRQSHERLLVAVINNGNNAKLLASRFCAYQWWLNATLEKTGNPRVARLQRKLRMHCWTIGLMPSDRGHSKDVLFSGELFSASYRSRVIDPKSIPKRPKLSPKIFPSSPTDWLLGKWIARF